MWDFSPSTGYELKDLFTIRDACVVLNRYGLSNEDMALAVKLEIERRAKSVKP